MHTDVGEHRSPAAIAVRLASDFACIQPGASANGRIRKHGNFLRHCAPHVIERHQIACIPKRPSLAQPSPTLFNAPRSERKS